MGALLNRVYAGPKRVLIHITKYCNTNCDYCGYHRDEARLGEGYINKLSERWTLDTFKELVEDLSALKTPELGILGEGDPLGHPDIREMVRIAKEAGMSVTIFTNGLLLLDDMIKSFCDSGLDRLHINVSGGSTASYEALHPGRGADYEKLVRRLKNVAALKKKENWDIQFTISQVITKTNYQDVPNMIRLSAEVGADNTILKPYVRTRTFRKIIDPYVMREEDLKEFERLVPGIEQQITDAGLVT